MYPKSVYCCQKVSINPCLLISAFCYIGCSYKRIYFRESIRKIAVVYLKPSGTSKIEIFEKIVNDCYFRCSTGFWIVWYFKGNKAKSRAYHEVRNVRFSENLACFVFLELPFWDSPFCLITDDLVVWLQKQTTERNRISRQVKNVNQLKSRK